MLQEAIRCDFDNWKVWDNILVISTDLKAFDESIRAFNRILDIKETHDDDQILGILCNSVIESVEDSVGNEKYLEFIYRFRKFVLITLIFIRILDIVISHFIKAPFLV